MVLSSFGRRSLLGGAAGLSALAAIQESASGETGGSAARGRVRIDVHCHHIPDFYRSSLAENGIFSAGGIPLPSWSPDEAVDFMDAHGIAAQVVSISEPGVAYLATAADRLSMAKQINDWTTDTLVDTAVTRLKRRFGAFAVLPLGDPNDPVDVENAVDEAVRAITELKMDGVGVFSHYKDVYLGDPKLDPLMEALDELGAFVFVHPFTPEDYPALGLPPLLYEFPFDTTRAAVNLTFHQVQDRYPNVRIMLAHAGGTLPYLAFRTSLMSLVTGNETHYDRFYYDTALSPAPSAMKSLREVTPVSHVMYATDWPFSKTVFTQLGDPSRQLKESFNEKQLDRVLRDNALDQLPRLRRRLRS